MKRAGTMAVLLAVVGAPATADALELGDGRLNINGNGEWGYRRTSRGSYVEIADESKFDTAMFDLLVTARPAEQLSIVAQLGFDPEEVGLEWGFAEWRFSDLARARAGKVKHPFGNYGETQFVGTARPLFTLPTAVYGPAEMAATAVSGVALTGQWSSDRGWALGYDVYGGAIELQIFEPYDVLVIPDGVPEDVEKHVVNNVAGARVSLTSPLGVVLRLSGYGGRITTDEKEEFTVATGGASVLYRGERLWFSAEAFGSQEKGFERQLAAYVEAAYFVAPKLQLAGRWEATRVELDDFGGKSPLLRHDEVALGLAWWFAPELVVKASVHGVKGFRFAQPARPTSLSDDRTLLFVAGAQFAF